MNKEIKFILRNCYWDGMDRNSAISFVKRCYGVYPTNEVVSQITTELRECTGIEWR